MDEPIVAEMLLVRKSLKNYALKLCHNAHEADDLVQETFLRAFAARHEYVALPGKSIAAWLVTILKHCFFSSRRNKHREIPDFEGALAAQLPYDDRTLERMEACETLGRIYALDKDDIFRDVLILIGTEGMEYHDIAATLDISEGTVKSRVHRARQWLKEERA